MPRRTTPQAKTDDLAFPVRVKIAVPPLGFGRVFDRMFTWLRAEVASTDWAQHSQPGLGCDTAAFYFGRTEDAHRFIEAFPELVLADGVRSIAYRSPVRP
jgi:hypothetical protein